MRHATIIGGEGFIGRHLLVYLRQMGWQVWVPFKDDPELLNRELGSVFYCAGLTADYLQRPFDTITAHVSTLNKILYRTNWMHLVYLSSTRVYDGLTGSVDESQSLLLNPNNPRHLYDLSKLLGESMCLQTGKASVARLSCVYKDEEDADGFLPKLMRNALLLKTGQLLVDSSPHFARDYVHLNDVMVALESIMNKSESRIYNVASGENVSNSALFSSIERICGVKIVSSKADYPAINPIVKVERMQQNFGWRPILVLKQLEVLLNMKIKG